MLALSLMLLLPVAKSRRVHKHGAIRKDANQSSTTEKVKLWEMIDEFAEKGIQFKEDDEVQGTFGRWNMGGFSKMPKHVFNLNNQINLELPGFSGKMLGVIPYMLQSMYESNDGGTVLVVQSEGATFDPLRSRHQDETWTPKFLSQLLTSFQKGFGVVMHTKFAGHDKEAMWFGKFPGTEFLDATAANQLFCPAGSDLRRVRKMIVPLEYAGQSATKWNTISLDRTLDVPFEKFEEDFAAYIASQDTQVRIKRLLGYRRGLLYLKYRCKDQKWDKFVIEKMSVMLKHHRQPMYEVKEIPGKSWKTPPTYRHAP